MSLIRKHVAVLQAWACLALVRYSVNCDSFMTAVVSTASAALLRTFLRSLRTLRALRWMETPPSYIVMRS